MGDIEFAAARRVTEHKFRKLPTGPYIEPDFDNYLYPMGTPESHQENRNQQFQIMLNAQYKTNGELGQVLRQQNKMNIGFMCLHGISLSYILIKVLKTMKK